jgi:hypothetical protein
VQRSNASVERHLNKTQHDPAMIGPIASHHCLSHGLDAETHLGLDRLSRIPVVRRASTWLSSAPLSTSRHDADGLHRITNRNIHLPNVD